MPFLAANKDLFFTKNDPDDPRLGDVAKASTLDTVDDADLVLLGYPDDEGIQLSGGRLGACLGPEAIRKHFYKMTPHLIAKPIKLIADLGDLQKSVPLAERHTQAKSMISELCKNNKFWISLGGGHDYGYADGAGFLTSFPSSTVINFDAHLDVRPLNKGPSSGTPFFRLLNEHSNFNFFEVGTQPQCNSKKHFEFVQSKKGQVFLFDAPIDKIKEALSKVKNTDLFISIDIDYFSSSLAPGCSQSWPIGSQNLIEFLSLLAFLFTNFKVRGVGIYETSPPLDVHDATAKLAACLAHQCLGLKMGSL